jgi:hypothetical protein
MSVRTHLIHLFFILSLGLSQLSGQSTLIGRTEGNQYVSPTGAFRVTIPVIASLGGSITDTENVVTFQDAFSTHQSVACFKMDATQRFEDDARGRKDYLIWFFSNFVQDDFESRYPGSRIESASFIKSVQEGALLTYNLLPGGSMFASRAVPTTPGEPPVAKRGNLVFVNNGYVYVLSIELAEKVLEGPAFNKTLTEEDATLRKRLLDLLAKITFTPSDEKAKPAATDKAAEVETPAPADSAAK